MAWTYGANPASSTLDAVRLLIGDTDTNDQQLQDGEIQWNLSKYSNNVYAAAVASARQVAARYARMMDSDIESVSVKASVLYKNYADLANKIAAEGTSTGNGTNNPIGVYVGGVTISDVEATDAESDRLPPAFVDGQFDNPPTGSVSNVWPWVR